MGFTLFQTLWACLVCGLMATGRVGQAEKSGTLVIVGGGETPTAVVRAMIAAAGGPDAPLVILAQTQEEAVTGAPESAAMYREQGAKNVQAPVNVPASEIIALLGKARGVWIPGGDQTRFARIFPEASGVPEAIRAVYRRGGVVGGTSAGASLMGGIMPTGEETKSRDLQVGACPVMEGLKLLPDVIVDQHFLIRNRLMRLLVAVMEHPKQTGLGIDQGAWIVVRERAFTVYGGQVVLARAVGTIRQKTNDLSKTKSDPPFSLLGADKLSLHVLLPGERARLP